MNVVVIYESRSGNTKYAAELIASGVIRDGGTAAAYPSTAVDLHAVSQADLIVVGTWTDGLFFFGQRPGGSMRLWQMPEIHHKRAAVFCTYAKNPGKTVDKLARLVEGKGATVVGGNAFHRNRLEEEVEGFVDGLLTLV